MTEALTDITGQAIEPGDTVVYPQMSGRSVQMVLGRLVAYDGKTAKIERLEGSRWSTGYASTRYRDKRTGKGVTGAKRYKTQSRSGYRHQETGEEISQEELYRRLPYGGYYGYGRHTDLNGIERAKWSSFYEPGVLHDHVEAYAPASKPVTITNVGNIVKVQVANDDA